MEQPTKEGYYWVKRDGLLEIVQVYKIGDELFAWTFTDERDHELNEFTLVEEVKGVTANE